ncbi:DUF2249 domain-containing protein [Evansella sp. AB-P1]|uniref:DUF2249 domain-containing protein n=1 Tax=Evansella sp. AB-P1 TaxID=3037653 RepID=UPI00241FB16D|nr:DUF2249 domain-containing protein [Evansella sp. AB-P1]MDG5789170.1 DUF2249 domain-containing protein [Evansella sp. AB-P1]
MSNTIELDVRNDIAQKNDPFQKIMTEVKVMETGDELILHTPFVPKPLLKVMEGKGFSHEVDQKSTEHFITRFVKEKNTAL